MKKFISTILLFATLLMTPIITNGAPADEERQRVLQANTSGSDQIIFEVPVRISNASSMVGSAVASCNVEFSTGMDAMGMPASVSLDAGGNLNRVFTVTVPFDAQRAEDATGYRCHLVLYNSSNGSLLAGGSMIETQSGIPLDPDATQVFVVSGTL